MLKKIRLLLAIVFWIGTTILFLDFTGTIHGWLGWMAKVQFVPAVLALNAVVIIALIVLTLLFGRIYCSVICPLGIMQDFFGWLGKKTKKNRYTYFPAKNILRYVMLGVFIIGLITGFASIALLIEPYSIYGRIAHSILAPAWQWGNNILAEWAESANSYAFYEKEIWLKGMPVLIVAAASLIIIAILAWRGGRTYCNTICPVGTFLGFISRFSLLKPVINTDKCNSCGLCARNCKASCIDPKTHTIDYSRCVVCMDCIGKCNKGAISYNYRRSEGVKESSTGVKECRSEGVQTIASCTNNLSTCQLVNSSTESNTSRLSRRSFVSLMALFTGSTILKAQEKTVDGGLAIIEDKKIPERKTPIVPAGAVGLRNMNAHCTGCQLCVSVCPNDVLRPSDDLRTFMQPEMSFERGYCRPECTKCSEVCPTGAIKPITIETKSSTQVGHAVWVKENCIPLTKGDRCGLCARRCPAGAITMVPSDPNDEKSPQVPAVNEEKCIGCGACEHLCPARPFSAIYVEGHEVHREI